MTVASLILAAGGSTRLGGSPKQLLMQDGVTLVRRITQAALSLQAGPVLVILGANQERIQTELIDLPVQQVANPAWQEGLASSLRAGMNALSDEGADAFLVLLTDQPFVTASLLQQLIDTRLHTQRGIIACRYGETGNLGVPALFDSHYKTEFLTLTGDVGARQLIKKHASDCAEVFFPFAAIDLDTRKDVESWQSSLSSLPLLPKWPDS